MIGNIIVCKDISSYDGKITRGKSYIVLDDDKNKEIVRVWTDDGFKEWFPYYCFEFEEKCVPILLEWEFDDEVIDDPDEYNWIEISFSLSDGTKRWSILYTPERLSNSLKRKNIDPPGLHIQHMIIVRSYKKEDIDRVLKYLDDNNELIDASRLLNPSDLDIEE